MASPTTSKLIPSTTLLLAILRPSLRSLCPTSPHLRHSSSGTYQSKPKPNRLDKLHRKQRADLRAEKQAARDRAAAMPLSDTSPSGDSSTSISFVNKTAVKTPTPRQANLDRPLPYTITRTPSAQLPIYHLTKAGGNKHITRMRKLSGDLHRLKEDVFKVLGFQKEYDLDLKGRKKENVAINWMTGQIVVRGWRGPEIKRWAEAVGF